jgi:opacity protein-like surface antigen
MKLSCFSAALALCATLFLEANARAEGAAALEPKNAVPQSNDFEVPHLEIAAKLCLSPQHPRQPQQLRIGAGIHHRPDPLGCQPRRQQLVPRLQPGVFSRHGGADFRGPENHYFGISTGFRHVFIRPGWRVEPYVSGGVGAGFIDSTDDFRNGQGQDHTFNILTAAGLAYRLDEHWKISASILYQHLSNGGQTDPNPSLNLLGPQMGATFSF